MWPFARARQFFVIEKGDIYFRFPMARDYEAWCDLRSQSRDFLQPWEPLWPEGDLSRLAFERRLHRYSTERSDDLGYHFFLFHRENDALLGGLSLNGVRRGAAQSAMLGYWMGQPFAGKGYMTQGVSALLPYAFEVLNLHRVEAACLPHNTASVRVLEKIGFQREGYARQYLAIAGEWKDHLLYALLRHDFRTMMHESRGRC